MQNTKLNLAMEFNLVGKKELKKEAVRLSKLYIDYYIEDANAKGDLVEKSIVVIDDVEISEKVPVDNSSDVNVDSTNQVTIERVTVEKTSEVNDHFTNQVTVERKPNILGSNPDIMYIDEEE